MVSLEGQRETAEAGPLVQLLSVHQLDPFSQYMCVTVLEREVLECERAGVGKGVKIFFEPCPWIPDILKILYMCYIYTCEC